MAICVSRSTVQLRNAGWNRSSRRVSPSRASPHARKRASAGRVGVGAPASGIETVTGGPVRCMNRVERLVGLLAARRPEPAMTVARSVADVLDDHVVFEVESIDRMYLNVWQPRLAYGGGVQGFFVGHRGYHYASTALMDPMTKAFVADIHGFV